MKKKWCLIVACLMMLCCAGQSLAATRAELAAINVSRTGNFKYWTAKAPSQQALVNYVKQITDQKSKDFIPVKDRVAVFDVDGTLMCETAPAYFDELLYKHRMFKDTSWKPSSKLLEDTQRLLQADKYGLSSVESDLLFGDCQARAFGGMSQADYEQYIRNFMQEPVPGLSNLKRSEAFYLPMVEVISYLKANDFNVYLVSGCDRTALRVLADGVFPLRPGQIIGTDTNYVASHQNGENGMSYQYRPDDTLVRGPFIITDVKMNKVSAIAKEIGQQPVLAFGNSSGDYSMFRYTQVRNPHKTAVFVLLCDDLDREFGNQAKAASVAKTAASSGWVTVSMKNDFKTIYGDKVNKEK